jgi:lysophospholipase L1-like esterase
MRALRSILVFAMLAVASCTGANASQTSGSEPEPAPSVFLVGDSISDTAGDAIDASFEREDWRHYRIAIGGKAVVDMRAYIASGAQLRTPDVMVIELGTNDMGSVELTREAGGAAPGDEEQTRRYDLALDQLDAALRDMRDVPCVVWLDVADWSDLDFSPHGHYNLTTWAPRYNAALRERQAQYPNLHVVSYAEQIRAQGMAWIDENFDDGWRIHPASSAAQQEVARIITRGVRDACGV